MKKLIITLLLLFIPYTVYPAYKMDGITVGKVDGVANPAQLGGCQ